MCEELSLPLLGRVPLDPRIGTRRRGAAQFWILISQKGLILLLINFPTGMQPQVTAFCECVCYGF